MTKTVTLKVWWLAAAAVDFYWAGRATNTAEVLFFLVLGVWMLWPMGQVTR